MADTLALLCLLIGLELVLGVDNVLVIAIFVGRLPEAQRQRARVLGLTVALVARIVMLGAVLALTNLTQPLISHFSIRDLLLIAGGLFLLWKAVHEIHHTIEIHEGHDGTSPARAHSAGAIIAQIVLLDIVFSLDSVITAVGQPRTSGLSSRRCW